MSDEATRARAAKPQVVIPNFNWRYSGVTAVNRTMAPLLTKRCRVAWLGMHPPSEIERLGLRALLRLRLAGAAPVIWHARRNVR